LKDSFLKRLSGIVGAYFTDGLVDDRAVIELVIDQMDRTAAHFDTIVDRGLMDMQSIKPVAAEGWDQRGMDVDDTPLEILWD
jgi:hypothetical protein